MAEQRPHDANCGDCDTAEFSGQTYDAMHRCGARNGQFVCDRDAGHGGDHRGYNEQIDEPFFWKGGQLTRPKSSWEKRAEAAEAALAAERKDATEWAIAWKDAQAELAQARAHLAQCRALIETWRSDSKKEHGVARDDIEDGIWAHQHEAYGRHKALGRCADELDAALALPVSASKETP